MKNSANSSRTNRDEPAATEPVDHTDPDDDWNRFLSAIVDRREPHPAVIRRLLADDDGDSP